MTNLASMLTDTAAEHGDRPALKLDDTEMLLRGARGGQRHVAGLLATRASAPGDRVGLDAAERAVLPVRCSTARCGSAAVVVPMNPLLKEREVGFHLGDSGAEAAVRLAPVRRGGERGAPPAAGAECVLVEPGVFEQDGSAQAEPVQDVAEREDGDTALILYTSGHHAARRRARSSPTATCGRRPTGLRRPRRLGPETVTLGALPLFHVFGLTRRPEQLRARRRPA